MDEKYTRTHNTIITLCEYILEQCHEIDELRKRRAEAVALNNEMREKVYALEAKIAELGGGDDER